MDEAGQMLRRALDRPIRPTRAEIDLGALRHNLAQLKRGCGNAEILAVVKANGYGHGAIGIASCLEKEGVRFLGVALVEEGIELRNAGIEAPILVLGGAYEGGYDQLIEYQLTPALFRPEHFEKLAQAADRAGRKVQAHLKIDTGMGRLGADPRSLDGLLEQIRRHDRIEIEGLLSHFANADLADSSFTLEQVERFKRALAVLQSKGIDPTWRHLSNSAGALGLPQVRDGSVFNLIRPGLVLYGLSPIPGNSEGTFSPVLSWKTAVIHLKQVPPGTPISYGGTWKAARDSVIATLPIGYADGYSRMHSNRGQVLVRGKRSPIVGRVCMDTCMIDVTDNPGIEVGDEVVLIGVQGDERIGAEELARWSQTIPYEVLCAVGSRVPRRII